LFPEGGTIERAGEEAAGDPLIIKSGCRPVALYKELFREIFKHAPFGMCVSGVDGRFLQVNAAFCRMLGYSEPELLATSWTRLTHPGDLEACLAMKERVCQDPDGCVEVEKRYIHRGGAVVWVRMKISVVRDSGGRPSYHVVHMEDITQRRQAQEALSESEARFRIMADGCPALMWVTDAQGGLQFINRPSGNCVEQPSNKWPETDGAGCFMRTMRRGISMHSSAR
jgi:PAS domain S-box-containing protein